MHVLVVGNANVDLILGPLSPWPRTGTEVLVDTYELRVGGALGNMALALHALGVPARYAANVGDDPLGIWLHGELEQHGCTLTVTPGPTAVTVGLSHPDAERTFISHLGHLSTFDIRTATQQVQTLGSGDMLLVCGYFLLPALREHGLTLCRQARERGVSVLLDTGWPTEGWNDAVRSEVFALIRACDYFLPNREELAGLTGEIGVQAGLSRLPESLSTVVKLGEHGAGYLRRGNLETVAAPAVPVIDTVGAGDTFNAALIYGLQTSNARERAVELAVRAASKAISSRPRTYPTPGDLHLEDA